MKYFRYSDSQLKGMGGGSVTIIHDKLIKMGIIEVITDAIQNLGNTLEEDNQFELQRNFNNFNDNRLINYHIVCYIAALLKLKSIDYIKIKRLFSDYEIDYKGISFYLTGIRDALLDYREKENINLLKTPMANIVDGKFEYNDKILMQEMSLPYFYDIDFTDIYTFIDAYSNITEDFSMILTQIREPAYAMDALMPIQHLIRTLNLDDLVNSYMKDIFTGK